uniref:Uncharacterized protein n=1 Tax=Anopheles dirus TaxID=7168 RepID=A0A182NWA6_9DIPT
MHSDAFDRNRGGRPAEQAVRRCRICRKTGTPAVWPPVDRVSCPRSIATTCLDSAAHYTRSDVDGRASSRRARSSSTG